MNELVCEYFNNDNLRFDNISIKKFDQDELQTAVELTMTGEIQGEYVTAEAEAKFEFIMLGLRTKYGVSLKEYQLLSFGVMQPSH